MSEKFSDVKVQPPAGQVGPALTVVQASGVSPAVVVASSGTLVSFQDEATGVEVGSVDSAGLITGTSIADAAGNVLSAKLDSTTASGTYARQQRADGGGFWSLKQVLARGESAHMLVLGDSTGDENTEWVYLLGQHIADLYPGYTVEHRLYDRVGDKGYFAPDRIQTGSSGRGAVTIASASSVPVQWPAVRTNTTDLDVTVRLKPSGAWGSASNAELCSCLGVSGNRVWRFYRNNIGTLTVIVYPDGINAQQFNSTAGPTLTSATEGLLRVTVQGDDGSGNSIAKFYQSSDGNTWAQIGSNVTKVGTTVNLPSTYNAQRVEVGAANGGTADTGSIYYGATIRDGIDGRIVATPNVSEWVMEAASTNVRSGSPTLTIWNGSIAGANLAYLSDSTRFPRLTPMVGMGAVLISDSHNETYSHGDVWRKAYNTFVNAIRVCYPEAALMALSQNPRGSGNPSAAHEERCREVLMFGPSMRMHPIDIHAGFLADGRALSVLINADGVHPDVGTGRPLWGALVSAEFDAA